MKVTIKHYGHIKGGVKTYYNPELYRNQLAALEGKEFTEIITQKHEKPSSNQHNYYRGGILVTCYQSEMFSHMNKKDDVHTFYFAPMFLTHTEIGEVKGKRVEVQITRSTADLNKQEMADFVTKVKIECNLLGIEVGEPQDYYSKFYNK